MESKAVSILVVDDDEVDRLMISRTFQKMHISNPLYFANNGREAIELLSSSDGHAPENPFMVLLDINMPKMSGLELLSMIRQDEQLKSMVVFMLTTSSDERDIAACYELQIAGYIVKSKLQANFSDAIDLFKSYWKVVTFPQVSI